MSIAKAGLEAWPKTFVNLRASRRTELEEKFPNQVINNWHGHSGRVAEKHYLQVTDDHWAAAAAESPAGGNSSAHQDASEKISQRKKPVITGSADWCGLLPTPLAPRTDAQRNFFFTQKFKLSRLAKGEFRLQTGMEPSA